MGFPHFVSIVVTYASPADLPTDDFLAERVQDLQTHFPLLYAPLRGSKTRDPVFQEGDKPWPSHQIIRRLPAIADDPSKVLQGEMERLEKFDLEADLIWQVALYTRTAESPAYLILSGNHALFDGRAIFNLLHALLAADISHLPYEQVGAVLRLSDTHDLRPGILYILGVAWTALLVPKLPLFIQPYLRPAFAWPGLAIRAPPQTCGGRFSLLELPASLIGALKAAGQIHGVRTLHPILKVSYAVAIWAVVKGQTDSVVMNLSTPGDYRDIGLGHGFCTGNYAGTTTTAFTPRSDVDFWLETAKIAAYLSSPAGKKRGLELMGSLSYVPDPKPDPAKRDTDRPTGWEDFFAGQMESTRPFSNTLNISNMGKVDLPDKATDLFWAQAASPLAEPFAINVVGHEKGLRVVPVWREGSVITKVEIDAVNVVWKRVLQRLADPSWSGSKLEELVRAV